MNLKELIEELQLIKKINPTYETARVKVDFDLVMSEVRHVVASNSGGDYRIELITRNQKSGD